jgi:hypothetical protein
MTVCSSLPRCSSTWDASRNQPRGSNGFITALLANVGCWLGRRTESEQRPTLTSSMVASIDIGSLSGYGYGSTLTSSVVAWLGCLSGFQP